MSSEKWADKKPDDIELAQYFRSMHEGLIRCLKWMQEIEKRIIALEQIAKEKNNV